jgi:streptogramin lyase
LPTAGAQPSGITCAYDGSIWFTETNANKLGRIGTSGVLTEYAIPSPNAFTPAAFLFTPPFGGATQITASPDGYVWFIEPNNGKIGRISQSGGPIAEFTVPVYAFLPDAITTVAGTVWFGGSEASGGVVGQISSTGAITIKSYLSGTVTSIAGGPDGNVWIMFSGTGTYSPYWLADETTAESDYPYNFTEYPFPQGSYSYWPIIPGAPVTITSMTVGPDNNFWFTDANDKIWSMTTSGVLLEEFLLPTGSDPQQIVAGPDGTLWFTEGGTDKIGVMTTAGNLTELALPTPASVPIGITEKQDGTLWFTEASGNRIGRIADAAIKVLTNQRFTATVATFQDLTGTGAKDSASIQWGDGTNSSGHVVPEGNGQYEVLGTHTYNVPGTYNISVQISGSNILPTAFSSTAQVTQAPPQSIGVFDPSQAEWYLRYEIGSGSPDAGQIQYGGSNWFPVVGDWNGRGYTQIGVVDLSTETWYLPGITPFQYGAPGWIPVAGDWNGSGRTGIAVVNSATETWYIRYTASAGAPDITPFAYGAPGWTPVSGDWNGTGHAGIGVVDRGTATWYLRNEDNGGAPDAGQFQYGGGGWMPVTGDWSGSGRTGIAVVDPATETWYIRNTASPGAPNYTPFSYGAPGWKPVSGNWAGWNGPVTTPTSPAGPSVMTVSGSTRTTAPSSAASVQPAAPIGRIADAGFSFHNSPLFSHVQVEAVYNGQGWAGSTRLPYLQPGQAPAGSFQAQQQIQQLNTFFNDITNSAHMDMLSKYGAGRGTFAGSDVDANWPAAGSTVTDAQIQNVVLGEIDKGDVPVPELSTFPCHAASSLDSPLAAFQPGGR